MPVAPIPAGYHTVTPYLAVEGAAKAIAFYAKAFGARERLRLDAPGGRIAHAELEIGDSLLMLADPFPGHGFGPPGENVSVSLHLYVEDVDKAFARAIAAGGKQERAVETMFYGDRTGTLRDPFGHRWHLASHVEDVSPEEIGRRAATAMKPAG